MSKQKVINFFAGPGAGKTTLMAGVFARLKMMGVNCEQAPEKTKEHEWEGRTGKVRECQDYIFAKQHFQLRRLEGEVDFIITDGPILLTLAYMNPDYLPSLGKVATEAHNRFNNFNFFVNRGEAYSEKGRGQTRSESCDLDQILLSELRVSNNPLVHVTKNQQSIERICAYVLKFESMDPNSSICYQQFMSVTV